MKICFFSKHSRWWKRTDKNLKFNEMQMYIKKIYTIWIIFYYKY